MADVSRVFLLKAHVPSGMEYFTLKQTGADPRFWINAAGGMMQSTTGIPFLEAPFPRDITPYDALTGDAPTWIEVKDGASTSWYLTSVGGVLTKNASPPGTGFGWDATIDGVGLWSQDPTLRYVITGHATNPYTITLDSGAEVPALYYSAGLGHQPAIFDGRLWEPRLLDIFDINHSVRISEGTAGGLASATLGNVTLDLEDESLDELQTRSWNGKLIEIWEGYAHYSFGQFVKRLHARTRGISYANQRFVIQLSDEQDVLGKFFHLSTYAGTGGLEGPVTLAGKPKPLYYGASYNPSIPMTPIDSLNDIYQASDGIPHDPDNLIVLDKGTQLIGDGHVADVYAWTQVPGHFVIQTDTFIFRLGAPPAGKLTCGANFGRLSSYAVSPPVDGAANDANNVLKQILDEHGISHHTSTIDNWNLQLHGLGYYAEQETTLQNVLSFLCQFAFWGFEPHTNEFFLANFSFVDVQLTLADDDLRTETDIQLQGFTSPPSTLRILGSPMWNVHRETDLIPGLPSFFVNAMTSEYTRTHEYTDARVTVLSDVLRPSTIKSGLVQNLAGTIPVFYEVLASLLYIVRVIVHPQLTTMTAGGVSAGSPLRPGMVVRAQFTQFDGGHPTLFLITGVRSVARQTINGDFEEYQELTLWGGRRVVP